MQDSRIQLPDDVCNNNVTRKKKITSGTQSLFELHVNDIKVKKVSKRNPMHQQPERPSNSDSSSGNSALRRKYLLLEEENFALQREVKEVEGEVTTLEDEKVALLDRLVVLEGLIDR